MKKILMTLTLAIAAMIAIPQTASAQDCKSEQKKECCKEKKDCAEAKKSCAEKSNACDKGDGKPCCKECKKGMHKPNDIKKGKGGHGHRSNGKMHRGNGENPMFKGITLSEEQKTKIKALREKNMTAEKKTKADMKAKSKEEMQKLRVEFDKEMEKILDKDQIKQYRANKADMEAKRVSQQSKLPKLEKKDK